MRRTTERIKREVKEGGLMKSGIVRSTLVTLLLCVVVFSASCGFQGDSQLYDQWTRNIYNAGEITTGNFSLTTPVYTSVDIPALSMQLFGSDPPEWKPFPPGNHVLAPLFEDQALPGNQEELFFSVQVPHGYVEESDITFYIHYAYMSDSVGEEAKFGIEYIWANQNELYGASSIIYRILTSTSNDAYYHYWVGFPAIDGTGKTIGSILVCRVFRNSSSGDDTYTGGFVALLGVDLICEVNTLGSTEKTTK